MRLVELQSKDVVNVLDGCKIGFVSDIEFDLCARTVCAIVVERCCFFKMINFLKEPPCLIIPMECVVTIGGDVILVNVDIL